MPPVKKKTVEEPVESPLENLVKVLEESVAYLEELIAARPELTEETVYDVVEAVIIALRAVNLNSTHALADEIAEKYFGPTEEDG